MAVASPQSRKEPIMKTYKVYFLIASTGNERCITYEAHTAKEARCKFESMFKNAITKVERRK